MNDTFQPSERTAAGALIELALAEDLAGVGDLTSRSMIDEAQTGAVDVVSRRQGVLAGTPVAELVFATLDANVQWTTRITDGSVLSPGDVVAHVAGPMRSLLTGERTALNFLTHLSGVATLTAQFVEAIAGTPAVILDTRKTTPGYRVLEKYAVRCGGGTNHRLGLYDGILIKDNHLAASAESAEQGGVAEAIQRARRFLGDRALPLEVEVDTLEQLAAALTALPDIVLLDNMPVDVLREAVAMRNEIAPRVQLEASGGVTLDTVRGIAETGVERISVGALTHSAVALDLAFDWSAGQPGAAVD